MADSELLLPYVLSEENFPDKAFIVKEGGGAQN
jgi:hypothetical protein